MERDQFPWLAGSLGKWTRYRFRDVGKKCPGCIVDVRGMGLMMGIELAFPGKEVWQSLLEQGFILNLTQEKVLRLLPALTISREDLELFAQALEKTLKALKK